MPDGLRLVIERAIRKDPGERYPAMGAMLEALQTVRRGDRVQPPAVPAVSGGALVVLAALLVLAARRALSGARPARAS